MGGHTRAEEERRRDITPRKMWARITISLLQHILIAPPGVPSWQPPRNLLRGRDTCMCTTLMQFSEVIGRNVCICLHYIQMIFSCFDGGTIHTTYNRGNRLCGENYYTFFHAIVRLKRLHHAHESEANSETICVSSSYACATLPTA